MTTIGLRLFASWAMTALVLSLAYGSVADSWQGFLGSLSALTAFALLAFVMTFTRDVDRSAGDVETEAHEPPPVNSWWPLLGSAGVGVAIVGLAVDGFLVGFGAVLVVVAAANWVLAAAHTRGRAELPTRELPLFVRDVPHLSRWLRSLDVVAIVAAGLVLLVGLADSNMSAVLALGVLTTVIASHSVFTWALAEAERSG